MNETIHEESVRLRRAHIVRAAIPVFAERGFHRATIRHVAKAACVADGTIYNYFENKSALLLAILDPLDEIGQSNGTDSPPEIPTDIRQFFREHLARRLSVFAGDNLPVLRIVLAEVLVNPELRALYLERVITPTFTLAEPLFRKLIADGALRPMDVPLTLRTFTATFLGLVMLRLMGDDPLQAQWDDLPDLLTTLLLDGMLPGDGIALDRGGSHDGTV